MFANYLNYKFTKFEQAKWKLCLFKYGQTMQKGIKRIYQVK